MKYLVLVFCVVLYSPALFADAAIFKCTVDGVATFQKEPCKEILAGKEESESAQYIVIDTSQNNVDKPERVTSDVMDRAKKAGYYYNYKYYPKSTSTNNSQNYYDADEARKKSEESYKKGRCESYRSQKRQLHNSMKRGYSSSQSKYLHEEKREISSNIHKYCK